MGKEIVELKAIRSEWHRLLPRIDYCMQSLSGFFAYDYSNGSRHITYGGSKELSALFIDFNTMTARTNIVLEPFNVRDTILPKPITLPSRWNKEDTNALLERAMMMYSGVDSLLSSLIEQPLLPPEKEKDLEVLRTRIEKNIEPDLPLFASDLKRSIESFGKADYLGSSLIAGRTIDVVYGKIKGILQKDKDEKIEINQIIDFLKGKGILEKGEHEGSSAIIGAIKIYRNKFSHKVGMCPDPEECLFILTGSLHLLNKIVEKNLQSELGL